MSTTYRAAILVMLAILVVSYAIQKTNVPVAPTMQQSVATNTAQPTPPLVSDARIVRQPAPVDMSDYFPERTFIPKFDPDSPDPFQVDLRSRDLTNLDMTASLADLMYAAFDSKTVWPASDKMPADFDWPTIMETGKDPGLGIRALHGRGITGEGVGIAIVDQTLLVDHIEYKDQIRVYEETDDIAGDLLEPQMHGPAVASIAVGKSVGVAPGADLYYIGTGNCGGDMSIQDFDFSCRAKAIQRIVEINQTLPADRRIRVLSFSYGWDSQIPGYEEMNAAVQAAKDAGIFVISSSLSDTYGFRFQGLGRDPFADPNQFASYGPGLWWQSDFYTAGLPDNILLVPMDARTTAGPTGTEDYAYYRAGGWSWAIPYLAGMYALAAQIKPDITPEEFWDAALHTGRTIQIEHEGKEYQLEVLLDPQALIDALRIINKTAPPMSGAEYLR